MNLQKLVSMFLITIFATSNIYSAQCINCVATINHNQNNKDKTIMPFSVSSEKISTITPATYSDDQNSPDYIVPLDDNEPSDIKIKEEDDNVNNKDQSEYHSEYQNTNEEENASIVLIYDTQEENLDSNHSILDNDTLLYACDDEQKTLVCDNVSKICECV